METTVNVLKISGFIASIFFGCMGFLAFSDGAWMLLVFGVLFISFLIYRARKSKTVFLENALLDIAKSMASGLGIVTVVAVIVWIVGGASRLNFGPQEKPEYTRAKMLMSQFSCPTSNGQWGRLMAGDRDKANGRLRLYEQGINPSTLSIDKVIENDLASFKIACEASNERPRQ